MARDARITALASFLAAVAGWAVACGSSGNCTETATCASDTTSEGGGDDASMADGSMTGPDGPGGDATVDGSFPRDAAGDTARSDASAPTCGVLGLPCCADAGCGGGLACASSKCDCPSGSTLCGSSCIPATSCCTSTDCTGGESCQSGSCACPSGESLCMGTCKAGSGCCSNADCGTGGQCSSGGVCSCTSGYTMCGMVCIPSGECCTASDCTGGTTNTCSGGTCTCNGSIPCGGGETCTSAGCACPSGQSLCDGTCIPSGECCTSNDCAGSTTNTCSMGTCTCNGGSPCAGGEICTTGGCACPSGEKLCGSTCISTSSCCSDNDCTSPPDVCHQSPGTCTDGMCSYSPIAPSQVLGTCSPPGGMNQQQTLNGASVDGICVVSVYYCSVTGTPSSQAAPPGGYINAVSNPDGCEFNGCGQNGLPATECQENFCLNANGNCGACAL